MQDTMTASPGGAARRRAGGRWIDRWEPEDPAFWEETGRPVARRNLIFSIFAEHLGFSVWLLWSIVAVNLKKAGFDFSTSQLFWLVAVPNLVGAFLRLPYTFAVPRFGGRNWTVVSALLLLVPTAFLVIAVSNPDTPYWAFLLMAATAGLGGGNFASSMANINFFYPERLKGTALGLNAAGGNIGVSVVQLLVPILIVAGGGIHLARAGYLWAVLAVAAAVCAWFFMDNLTAASSNFREQVTVVRHKHTWVMSFLYIGTFGSFIGYSAAFPLIIKTQFEDVTVAHYAFLGALVGSLSRPFGGWLSDKIGGARVTFWNFAVMGAGVLLVINALRVHSFGFFLASFLLMFVTAGIGNGSTYRMIPVIFQKQALVAVSDPGGPDRETALRTGRREGAAVIGIASSIGAFGGFLIPLSYGTWGVVTAFYGFLVFYGVCLAVTWWYYTRKRFLAAQSPSLAHATI
jgi:MFS transporter, NNP family, nitrate/nitrite transporter